MSLQLNLLQQLVPAPRLAQLKPGFTEKLQAIDGSTVRNSVGTPVSWLLPRYRYDKPVRAASSVGTDVRSL